MSWKLDSSTVVGVIGAGSMGSGIAQLAAQSGHVVRLFDAQAGAAERALTRIDADLAGAVKKGRLDEHERAVVRSRLAAVDSVDALAGCGLVVEAIVERVHAKKALFKPLRSLPGARAGFATTPPPISLHADAPGLSQPHRAGGAG